MNIFKSTSKLHKKNTELDTKLDSYRSSINQNEKKSSWYSCLITNTHRIPIRNYIFWDWEDYYYH